MSLPRSRKHGGSQPCRSATPKRHDLRANAGSFWDMRVAYDELEDFLFQDRPPLPLLPGLMGMARLPPHSHRSSASAVNIDSRSNTVIGVPPKSREYHPQEDDSMQLNAEYLNTPVHSSPLDSSSDTTAAFDFIGMLDDHTDSWLFEQSVSRANVTSQPIDSFPEPVDHFGVAANAHRNDSTESHSHWGPFHESWSPFSQSTRASSSGLSTPYTDPHDLFDFSEAYGDITPATEQSFSRDKTPDWELLDEIVARPEPFPGLPPEQTTRNNSSHSHTTDEDNTSLCCWEHGCNGKQFSTRSNLQRHQMEKGKARPNFKCPTCGAFFSRTTARNQHVAKKSCNRVRRYSNGRERPGVRVIDTD